MRKFAYLKIFSSEGKIAFTVVAIINKPGKGGLYERC